MYITEHLFPFQWHSQKFIRALECVPPFTHGVLCRAMRFTIPTVMRETCDVKPTPPAEAA